MSKMTKKKNLNIEFLRVLSMLMVVTLHALGKGDLLKSLNADKTSMTYLAWVLESFAIVAVNVYVLISGYLLCESRFRIGRLLELCCEVWFYSIVIYVLNLFLHFSSQPLNSHTALMCVLPLNMDTYWFMTAYVVMYIFSPLLKLAAAKMSQKQFGTVVCMFAGILSVFKTVLPVTLETDRKGYDAMWFFALFLIGAYLKKYGCPFIKKPSTGGIIYLVFCVLVFAEKWCLDFVYVKTGHLETIQSVSYHYNHLFVLLASIGLFEWVLLAKEISKPVGKVAGFLAPMALGVYLIHEQFCVRFEWTKWLGLNSIAGSGAPAAFSALARVFGAVLCVYIVASLIDFIRIQIFNIVKKLFRNTRIVKSFAKSDGYINGD